MLTERWVPMTPVLTQLRNPRTQPQQFHGFILAVMTHICWMDILLHKTSHCLRTHTHTQKISRYGQLPMESRAPRPNICRKESVMRIVRRKSLWCQWRWGYCIANQSKWVLIVPENRNHQRTLWGSALQAGRSRVRFPIDSLDFSLT